MVIVATAVMTTVTCWNGAKIHCVWFFHLASPYFYPNCLAVHPWIPTSTVNNSNLRLLFKLIRQRHDYKYSANRGSQVIKKVYLTVWQPSKGPITFYLQCLANGRTGLLLFMPRCYPLLYGPHGPVISLAVK